MALSCECNVVELVYVDRAVLALKGQRSNNAGMQKFRVSLTGKRCRPKLAYLIRMSVRKNVERSSIFYCLWVESVCTGWA